MAYGRYARRRRAPRRYTRRPVRRTRTRYRRTTTRVRRTRRAPMTRRRIHEITSKKKRDNMLTFSNVNIPRTPPAPIIGTAALLQGGGPYYHMTWSPTAREKSITAGTESHVIDESSRTASTTYVKGLRERISIQSNSAASWTWRRIVFEYKGTAAYFGPIYPLDVLTTNGYARGLVEITGTALSATTGLVFDGQAGTDWRDPLNAKVDTSLITLHSDKTMVLQPELSTGLTKNLTRYYSFEKNLHYQEDEVGGETLNGKYAQQGKNGMGDVIIYDIIAPKGGSTFADQMTIDIQATYYWHEK